MTKKIGYYPGCSLEGSSREYSESVVTLAKAFDVELTQVPDWNCCGATAAHNLNNILSFTLQDAYWPRPRKPEWTPLWCPALPATTA